MGGATIDGDHEDESTLHATTSYAPSNKKANCTAKRPPDLDPSAPHSEWEEFCDIPGCRASYHCDVCWNRKDQHVLHRCSFAQAHKQAAQGTVNQTMHHGRNVLLLQLIHHVTMV